MNSTGWPSTTKEWKFTGKDKTCEAGAQQCSLWVVLRQWQSISRQQGF